jgi:hypothetical protein
MFESIMSSDVADFVNGLLQTEPGPAHSIQLDLDTGGDVHGLFEFLLMTMTSILKRWYDPPITIGRISEDKLVKLIGYFASFGYNFHLDVEESPRIVAIRNRDYLQKSRLPEMKFQMAHEDRLYTVKFSILPTA